MVDFHTGICRGGRSAVALAILVVLVYGLFVGLRVWFHGGDPSDCIGASTLWCDPRETPEPIKMQSNTRAYDGLFFYRLALCPWNTDEKAFGIRFDNSSYRHQRVGYPLVCWLSNLGRPHGMAMMMIVVNLLWLGILAVVCVNWARAMCLASWWGLLPLLWPGFLMTLGRDLCEIQAVTLLVLGCWLLFRGKMMSFALAFAGAVLTRETTVLPIAGLGFLYAGRAIRSRDALALRKMLWWLVPAIALLGWHAFLYVQYGNWPAAARAANWSPIPFKGLFSFILNGLPFSGTALSSGDGGQSFRMTQFFYYAYRCMQFGLCLFVMVLTAIVLRSSKSPFLLKISWIFAGWVFWGLTEMIFVLGPSSFLRVGVDGYVLGLLVISAGGKLLRRLVLLALLVAWGSGFICYTMW